MEEGRSAIWARLDGVEREFTRMQNERDQAILERDQARAALGPILEQVEKLRETVLGQMSKRDARLPSARAYSVTPEMVDGWVRQYEGGMSLTKIAQSSKTKAETIKVHLEKRGIEVKGKRRYGHGQRKEVCLSCGKEVEDGGLYCETCQGVDRIVDEHRAARVPRCKECGLALDSPALTEGNVPAAVDGVCGLCQFIASDLAERRRGNGHGQALGAGPTVGESV